MNNFGTLYSIQIIGSSHGEVVGVVIDGIPPGLELDINEIQLWLNRRKPGQSKLTSPRIESDQLRIKSGLFNGVTNGQPLLAIIENKDVDSSHYEKIKDIPRPGHADFPAYIKYNNANDYRGGGTFSGRLTISIIIAGAIALQILKQYKISVITYTKAIGNIEITTLDPLEIEDINQNLEVYENHSRTPKNSDSIVIEDLITKIKDSGDSVGGIVECLILNLPIGIGEPFFDSIESKIAHLIFSIPAVKGIEFGSGFFSSKMRGSKHNDQYYFDKEKNQFFTKTNNAGGILGGLSNGMPINFRVAFKPTSSIKISQETVNLKTREQTKLKIKGRHDPCIVPRAVPVVHTATACVILDLMMVGGILSKYTKFDR